MPDLPAEAAQLPQAEVVRTRGLSPVWIVPLAALIVAGALVLRDWLGHGPTLEVAVASADGAS